MTKKQPKEVRVDAILEAAVEVFLEKGYEGASVDAIAKRAGVSKGGFYHHFPNKEILLMEANTKLSEPMAAMAEKAFANPSPLNGLTEYIREYLSYWADKPKELSFLFLSMSKSIGTPVLSEYYKEYYEMSMAFFVGMFEKAVAAKEIDTEDCEAYGISLMGALDGLVSYAILNPTQEIELIAGRFEKVWLQSRRR